MLLSIRVYEKVLEISKNRKRQKNHLVLEIIFILFWYVFIIIEFTDPKGPGFLMIPFFFVPLFLIPQIRDKVKIIRFGEVLTLDKEREEMQINSRFKRRLSEIARVELFHHEGDDVDTTYLKLIFTDSTSYDIDQVNIRKNEELKKAAGQIEKFLNIEVSERQHRRKWIL